jgi:hypothetical protein
VNLVLVLDDGYDEAKMKECGIKPLRPFLSRRSISGRLVTRTLRKRRAEGSLGRS